MVGRKLFVLVACFAAACVRAAAPVGGIGQIPRVAPSAVAALGQAKSAPVREGFLFVNDRYVKPPYTVGYQGNAIVINDMLIDKPLPWPEASGDDAPPPDFSTPAEPGGYEAPAVMNDEPATAETPMAGNDPATEAPVEAPTAPPVEDGDGFLLFPAENDPQPVARPKPAVRPVQPVRPAVPQPVLSADPAPVSTTVSDPVAVPSDPKVIDQHRQTMTKLVQAYHNRLRCGHFIFVGNSHARVTGTYASAKTLVAVLPEALRYSANGNDLMTRLQQANIFFLDSNVCAALHANRVTFLEIDQRRIQLETAPPPPVR